MIYAWEPEDIICGRYVKPRNGDGDVLIGYRNSETCKVFALISLDDGLVFGECATAKGIADHLNGHGYTPCDIWPAARKVQP